MKCPVCKIELELSIQEAEEIYYDCSNCDSSLLFKNGDCEILNEGNPQKELSGENNPKEEGFQENINKENIGETVKSESDSLPENLLQNALEEENEYQNTEEEDEKLQNEKPDEENQLPPETNQIEEEFLPDETTQVPELKLPKEEPEQDFAQTVSEQKKESLKKATQDSAMAEQEEAAPDHSLSKTDFPFKEELEESSFESEDVELQKKETSKTSKKEDFSEVVEFGNTQDQDRQGPFLYDLILSEINSQHIREKVLSILEDESLNLPLDKEDHSIQDNIKNGKLIIEKISPVQAYIIVTFLMGLPLDISWKQHHIAESSSTN